MISELIYTFNSCYIVGETGKTCYLDKNLAKLLSKVGSLYVKYYLYKEVSPV